MNFINIKKIPEKIRNYPWRETTRSLKYLPKVLTIGEKSAVIMLLALILLLGGRLWYNNWINTTKVIPNYGGEFREGIIGDSKNLNENITRLVNAGLTKYDNQKNVIGDLAQSWDINDSGKNYVFHLRPGFNANDLISQITAQNLWTDVSISAPDEQTISFTFKQPFSPFLNVSTKPIFNYGPYQLTKESKDQVDLQARDDYYGGRPYIDKISLIFYQNQTELDKAVERGDVQSYAFFTDSIILKNSQKFQMDLPRDLDLFFNLSNKDLADLNIRKALRDNTTLNKQLNLRLVTSDTPKNLEYAQKLKDRWAQIGASVTIDVKDNVTLQKTTIPKRDYDLLLYGLDYGEDPDPYPFWHSSQIGENGRNLANFNNKQADKLLEDARQQLDSQKRQDDYTQFQQIIDQQVPMFVVEHQGVIYQISNTIHGINAISGTSEADRFLGVSQWYIKTKRVKIN